MYARVRTASLYGLYCESCWVEVDVENGLPSFSIVGLANQSIKEAKERIYAAIRNSGFEFDQRRITVNLTPANRKKEGSHFDLPIALGFLLSTRQLKGDLQSCAFLGELTLDGRLVPVDGILPMLIELYRQGVRQVVIPAENLKEAVLVRGMEIIPAQDLASVVFHISGDDPMAPAAEEERAGDPSASAVPDFADILGQESIKRAAQIAAAGLHGMLMVGPPGAGKTMICKRIPGILPPLSYEEQLEVTQIYSVAGELSPDHPLIQHRPFRAPHHSSSAAALIGGGGRPRPGEISLAHNGVLFLDELPEFSAHVLDMLRQPLEDGFVSINRASGRCIFPASFMLVAAMNPCRCGYWGDGQRSCTCTQSDRQRYMGRVSGPLLDRIDMHVRVERVPYEEIAAQGRSEISSEKLREGVMRAFAIQKKRYEGTSIRYNSDLTPEWIGVYCKLDEAGETLMGQAFARWHLSARSYHRILRLARTIADLAGSENIETEHLLEAFSYRQTAEE